MSFDAVCLKCSIVSVRRKHVWSSQGLPLLPFIWSDQMGNTWDIDGGVGQTLRLSVRQDGTTKGLQRQRHSFRRAAESDPRCCSYLHCVLLLALGGDTDGPRRSFKRRVQLQGGRVARWDRPIWDPGWGGFRQRGLLAMAISLLDWTPVRPCLHKVIVLYLARGTLVILNWFFFVWRDRREKAGGCCFNWVMMGWWRNLWYPWLFLTSRGKELLIGARNPQMGRSTV